MAEIQHPYECQCKGHEGGSRTFFAAPPEWYQNKGINTPRNCPDCRKWINAQADEMVICACSTKFRISAKAKINQFKKVGPYEPVTECHSCQEGRRPPKVIKRRPDRKQREKRKKDERPSEFSRLLPGVDPEPRMLLTDGKYYTDLIPGKAETRIEHIGRHLTGSPYDLTTKVAAEAQGLSRTKSPTSFSNSPDVKDLLASTQEFLKASDKGSVREYMDRGRIVRVTFTGNHDRLELSILEPLSDGTYGLVTTYDNVTVSKVQRKSWYNS
jgi:hypothetical protein